MAEVVAPICLEKGAPATFFLTTAYLDNRTLGFRHKASVLIDACDRIGHARSTEALTSWATRRDIPASGLADSFRLFFRSIVYARRELLDEAAEILWRRFRRLSSKESDRIWIALMSIN